MGLDFLALLVPQFLDPFLHPDERDEPGIDAFRRAEKEPTERLARAIESLLVFGQEGARIARYTTPTVVLHARHDPLVPLVEGERLAALGENAALAVLEAHSHMLPLTHAEEVARQLFA